MPGLKACVTTPGSTCLQVYGVLALFSLQEVYRKRTPLPLSEAGSFKMIEMGDITPCSCLGLYKPGSWAYLLGDRLSHPF